MIPLVAAEEAARLDAATARDACLSSLLLMEGAALRIWQVLEGLLSSDPGLKARTGPLVALAGGGNNGGDALAVLRLASFAGLEDVAAILVTEQGGPAFESQLTSIKALGIKTLIWEDRREDCQALLATARVLLDGIAGTGLKGPLRGPAADLARAANGLGGAVLAIDLPSGLGESWTGDSPCLKATWTASVEPRKACLYFPSAREYAGAILPIKGVFPSNAKISPAAQLLEPCDLPGLLPRISETAYKGSRGRLGLFAGSPGMLGAAGFASGGACAGGAGLVTLYADSDIYAGLSTTYQSGGLSPAVIKKCPEYFGEIGHQDAVVVGPGWGQSSQKLRILRGILESDTPVVIDADALRLLPDMDLAGRCPPGPRILCPHPGEFEALAGVSPGLSLANPSPSLLHVASRYAAVVIFKTHVTWIASPDGRLAIWDGLEAGLATAGSGDVLAGLAGAFLARHALSVSSVGIDEAFKAACAAVIVHGLAGRQARQNSGWFTAADLVGEAALLTSRPGLAILAPSLQLNSRGVAQP